MPYVNRISYSYGDHPSLHSVSIYYQGCDKFPKCKNCHNPHTWEPFKYFNLTDEEIISTVESKVSPLIRDDIKTAIVFLGGEPLTPYNRDSVLDVSKYFKLKYGDMIVTTLYSWREIEDIKKQGLFKFVEYIDEFILGPYIEELKVENKFPASENQMYINKQFLLQYK